MNQYDKLDHEHRTWDLKETAAFLGYNPKHFWTLVREGKLDGCWMKVKGKYQFCPVKVKELMEKGFNGNGGSPKPASNEPPEKEHDGTAA